MSSGGPIGPAERRSGHPGVPAGRVRASSARLHADRLGAHLSLETVGATPPTSTSRALEPLGRRLTGNAPVQAPSGAQQRAGAQQRRPRSRRRPPLAAEAVATRVCGGLPVENCGGGWASTTLSPVLLANPNVADRRLTRLPLAVVSVATSLAVPAAAQADRPATPAERATIAEAVGLPVECAVVRISRGCPSFCV